MIVVAGNLAQRTKQIIIGELRFYFQSVSQMGLPGNPIKMPIVRESFGVVIRQYPIIAVKILHEEPKNLGIGRDFVEDVMSDDQLVGQKYLPGTENFKYPVPYKRRVIAERYGYMADITFNLQVWGDTTAVRNDVVDEVVAAFKYFQRQSLLDIHGIQLMRISMGEETDFPLDESQKIYVANINLVVNAEVYFDEDVTSIIGVNTYSFNGPVNPSPNQPAYIIEGDYPELGAS
jgi:hypothetical protein